MSSTCDKTTQGIWNPTIHQGQTFNPVFLVAVNGVNGYAAGDTFFGWITDEEGAAVALVDYTFTLTDPVNGLVVPSLTPAQTLALPKGALFHSGEWHRLAEGDVIPIFGGRPQVKARSKG